MHTILIGILFIIICISLSFFAFRYFNISKAKASLVFILALALFVRVFISSDNYLHQWDEKYHALVAKNLTKHPLKPSLYEHPILEYDYKNWLENHIWLDKGPIPLWSMALSLKIFGNNVFALRLPSLILSLLAVFLTFLIASTLFNKRIGLLAAFFHAINGLLIEVAAGKVSSDHVETFFIFLVEAAILLVVISVLKKKGYLYSAFIGIFTGLAILSKWSPALLVFPLWLLAEMMHGNKTKTQIIKNISLSLASCVLIVAPWFIYINHAFPEESSWIFKKFIFAYNETLEHHQASPFYYFQNVGMVFCEIIWIPILISFYQIAKKQADWRLVFLNTWWLIPFIIFSLAATKRMTYMLIAAPAFFVILSYYWFYIYEHMNKRKWLKILVLALLILLPVRYLIERSKSFSNLERNPAWALELKEMQGAYPKNTIFFNEEHAIEGMFYTDYIFYTRIPNEEEIELLENNGYQIIIKD